MATWVPINGLVVQLAKNADGSAAADYYLKFYDEGTTTPATMATDSTGGTTLDKCKLNSVGLAVNGSDDPFIPHIDRNYKLACYTNATDADNNATGSAFFVIDNIKYTKGVASGINYTPEGTNPTTVSIATYLDKRVLDDVTALRAYEPVIDEDQVFILGHTNKGVGGGKFYYDETDTTTADNGGTVIVTAGGNRWKRPSSEQIDVTMFGALGNGVVDDTAAIQAALDSMTAYGSSQNSGSFQQEVTIEIPDGTYMISSPLTRTYRNNFRIVGSGELKATSNFSGGDYLLELIACSHLQITGIKFNGNSHACKSALRLSGDGSTGTKRNSTNIKVEKCFFYQFGATGTNSYVVDTLSPNGIPGDYSIDDSSFVHCNWLSSYGGGLRLASSEIQIVGGKMSFIGIDETLPMINLGNGSSMNISDFVFTGANANIIKADAGASIGRIKASGVYTESTDKPFYYQDGGTCRYLNIQGGYFAGLNNANTPFIQFVNGCRAQVAMYGNTFQSNGYTTIQLGDSGSLVGDLQTSQTSYKSYVPAVVGGAFTANVMGAQPSQSGMTDKKRYLKAIHDEQNATELEIHVDLALTYDQPWALTFSSFQNAIKYIDQIGYTKCKIVLDNSTSHTIDEDITICGDVEVSGSSLTWNITGQVTVKSGGFLRIAGTINYGNHAFVNRGGNILFYFASLYGNASGDYLIKHDYGFTNFVSCSNNTQGNLCDIDGFQGFGEIHLSQHTFNSNPIVTDVSPNRLINLIYHNNAVPTGGYWQVGSYIENTNPTAGGNIGWVCTTAGSPGTWKTFGSIAV